MVSRILARPPAGSDLRPVRGSFGLPYLGHALPVTRRPFRFFVRARERFGPLAWSGLAGHRIVLVQDLDAAHVVLADREKIFPAAPALEFLLGRFLAGSLLSMDYTEHRHHRRLIQQALTRRHVDEYLPPTLDRVHPEVDAWTPGPRFRAQNHLHRLVLGLAFDTFFGIDLQGADTLRVEAAFHRLIRAAVAFIRFPVPGLSWWRGQRARAGLEEFLQQRLLAKEDGPTAALWASLSAATGPDGHPLTEKQLLDHVIFTALGGHHNTATALTTTTYYLAKHPEWQDRLREESLALHARAGTELGVADLASLESLGLVLREALRMLSVTSALLRYAAQDTSLLGHHIPRGTYIAVATLTNHYLPEHWTNPDVFDPERYTPARREETSHRLAWMPYGAGAHVCPGINLAETQMRAIIHRMLVRYRWNVPDHYTWTLDFSAFPVPRDGLPVHLEPITPRRSEGAVETQD